MNRKVDQRYIDVYLVETPVVTDTDCTFRLYGKTKGGSYLRVNVKMSRSMFCHFAGKICRDIAEQFSEKLRASLLNVTSIFNQTW